MKKVISFHPELVEKLGSIENSLFYQQIWYWSDKGGDTEGYIWKTIEEFKEETTLSRFQQENAIKKLTNLGWLDYKIKKVQGVPKRHFKPLVNMKIEVGFVINSQMEMLETSKSEMLETSKSSITENTTEKENIFQEVAKATSTPSKQNFKIVNTKTKSSILTSNEKINIIYNLFKEFNFEVELWGTRKQNREAAKTLYEKKGVDKVRNILKFYKNEFKGTTVIGNTYDLVNKYDIIKKEFNK